jgi:hypothetical protein
LTLPDMASRSELIRNPPKPTAAVAAVDLRKKFLRESGLLMMSGFIFDGKGPKRYKKLLILYQIIWFFKIRGNDSGPELISFFLRIFSKYIDP